MFGELCPQQALSEKFVLEINFWHSWDTTFIAEMIKKYSNTAEPVKYFSLFTPVLY